jgi:hypothetical protein
MPVILISLAFCLTAFGGQQPSTTKPASIAAKPELINDISLDARMPSDLQNELAVPSFTEEATGRRPFNRQSAKNKWLGRKPKVLSSPFPIQPDTLDRIDLTHPPLRNDVVGVKTRQ